MSDRFEFEQEGRTYLCENRSGGVASVAPGGLARIDNAAWYVTVDGREYRTVDSEWDDLVSDESRAELQRRIIESVRAQEAGERA